MTSTRKVTPHPAARAAARTLKSKVATATTRPPATNALSTPAGASSDLTGKAAAAAASRLIRATVAARAARPFLSQRLVRRSR